MSKEKTSFGQSDIVRLSDEDAATELLERAVTGLWEVVNELTRFRRTTRQNYRVTIFGSARLKPGTPAYDGVKQLAAELTKMGCDIISGGGPGLMQAANEGAQSIEKATHRSVGIRVELPFEQEELLERAVTGLWEVVNDLTRFRRTTRQNYRVTIFGSARLKSGTPPYDGVKQLAAELTKMGCDIISGGGPGLMQAANEGAQSIEKATHRSVGIRVELPFEQEINPFVGQAYEHRTFFSRLHHFMIISDAFVVVPGGIGTLLELSLAWQLLQVRKLYNTPLILVGKMWAELVEWSRRSMLQKGNELASEIDFTIPHCVNTIDECRRAHPRKPRRLARRAEDDVDSRSLIRGLR